MKKLFFYIIFYAVTVSFSYGSDLLIYDSYGRTFWNKILLPSYKLQDFKQDINLCCKTLKLENGVLVNLLKKGYIYEIDELKPIYFDYERKIWFQIWYDDGYLPAVWKVDDVSIENNIFTVKMIKAKKSNPYLIDKKYIDLKYIKNLDWDSSQTKTWRFKFTDNSTIIMEDIGLKYILCNY